MHVSKMVGNDAEKSSGGNNAAEQTAPEEEKSDSQDYQYSEFIEPDLINEEN